MFVQPQQNLVSTLLGTYYPSNLLVLVPVSLLLLSVHVILFIHQQTFKNYKKECIYIGMILCQNVGLKPNYDVTYKTMDYN